MDNLLLEGAKKDLLLTIKRRGQLSVGEAIKFLPLAKATLRQHLLKMEEMGIIARRYSSSSLQGRPEVIFELTARGEGLFPNKSPEILGELLEHLKEDGRQDTIDSFLRSYWKRRRQDFEKLLDKGRRSKCKSSEIRLRREALRILLEGEGFMPEILHRGSSGVTVKECHCPFADVLPSSTAPCILESEFISWALKTRMERKSYIPKGDKSCSYAELKD